MRTQILAAALAVASIAMSGCMSAGVKLTPEQALAAAQAFHNAGCGGRVDIDAGAATGQLGGAAHVSLGLHGECPVGPPAPPSSTGQPSSISPQT